MKRFTKQTIKTVILTTALFSLSATASSYSSDGQRYGACKNQVVQQFSDIKRVKAKAMKTRQGVFTAKIKLTPEGGGKASLVACKIDRQGDIAITCLNDACEAQVALVQ